MNKVDIYEQRIRDIFPELSIEEISLHEGLDNDIVEVNNELIFRFPKHASAVEKLNQEVKILHLIKNYITLDIPHIFCEHREVIGYFMMCGVPLRKDILSEIDEQILQVVAEQLATFLKELHTIPVKQIFDIPNSEVTSKYEDWIDLYERLQDEVFPRLMSHTREWAKRHFESFLDNRSNFEYEPKLIHGDLGVHHILFDKQKNCVSGIIDFGTAGLGDPAMDIAVLIYNYGEFFLSRFKRIYPELYFYLKGARFYAETFELQWALSGIKSKDITWFLSHLGSAKDIKYQS
jgi:aminoglycoside 2''-phosphotransferase